jgi:curli biogenesis system outer membrane secretion channel CsgG
VNIFLILGCATPSIKEKYSTDFDITQVKSVAVFPFTETYSDATQLQGFDNRNSLRYEAIDILSMELMDSRIKVLERIFLDKILEEQKLSLTGIMEQDSYDDIGKILKVDLIITGNISLSKSMGNRSGTISARAIDTVTGKVVYTAYAKMGDPWGGLNISNFREALISSVGKKLVKYFNK